MAWSCVKAFAHFFNVPIDNWVSARAAGTALFFVCLLVLVCFFNIVFALFGDLNFYFFIDKAVFKS